MTGERQQPPPGERCRPERPAHVYFLGGSRVVPGSFAVFIRFSMGRKDIIVFALRASLRRMLLAWAVVSVLGAVVARPVAQAAPALQAPDAGSDLFGMVIRDPYYEYNTDPVQFPDASNMTALEREAAELEAMGVRWVRTEFWTDGDA